MITKNSQQFFKGTDKNEPTSSPPSPQPLFYPLNRGGEVRSIFSENGFWGKTPTRLDPWRLGTDASRTDSSIFTMKAHFLIFFCSFLFNFLSFPFSNLGFLILLSWLPQARAPRYALGPTALGDGGVPSVGVLILH